MSAIVKGSRPLFFPIFIFFIISPGFMKAQSSSLFSHNKYTNGKGDTLNYRLLYPDYNLSRRYPLVVFLHGMGERGSDNEAQLKWGVKNFGSDEVMSMHPAIVIAPQCPADQYWSNNLFSKNPEELKLLPVPSKAMELVIELIYQLMKTMPVDTNRIYITGLSMGGFGTFDAIMRYPQLFAAAVPVCGGGDLSKAASIAHIPVWIFHGADDPSVNPEFSFSMAESLKEACAHPGLTIYPGVGHFSWLQAYSDPVMIEWLFRQHK